MSNRLRKGIATFMTGATVLWSVGAFSFTVSVASAAAGDIIKDPKGSAVYMVLSEGDSICRLVTEGHYDMWAMYKAKGLGRWQDVQTVDTSTFTDKGVCSLRVGSLVRTTANPEVFVIQNGMMKRGFDSWETYVADGYKSGGVYFVTDEVLGKYTTGAKITSATTSGEIREGQLVKYADSATVYYVAKEGTALAKREVVNENAYFSNFGINWNLVITIPASETYTSSTSQLTGADTSINRPIAAGTGAPAPAGTVTFTLASDSPSGTLAPTLSYGNVFTKYVLSAGSDTTITSIKVKRDGLGARGDFSSVYLYVDGNKFTTARTFNSDDTALFSLGSGLMVKANTPMKLDIVADMAAIGSTGQHKLGIAAAADITTNGTVSGSFPLMGNFISTSTTRVGEMTITSQTISDTEIFVGEQQQELARFEFKSGSAEKVRLNSVRFRNVGSAKLSDYANFTLYKGGTKIDGTEVVMNGDYVTIKNINLTFDKSQTNSLKLYGDVISGATSTIQFSIEEAADVSATGLSYGYGVTVDSTVLAASPTAGTTATWTEQKSNTTAVTILAGELTFAISGPAAYSIDRKANDNVIATVAITAASGETITIKKMYSYITLGGSATESGIENIQLIQKTGGTQVIDATISDGSVNTNRSFYFANFDVKGATTWDVIADTNDANTANNNTWQFFMRADNATATVADNASVTPIDAQNSSSKSVTNIKPASLINGQIITLLDSSLTVTGGALGLAAENAVAQQKDIPLLMMQLIAGTSGDVRITSIKFENATGNTAVGSNHLSNFSLYEVTADGTVVKKIQGGEKASAASTTFTTTFGSLDSGKGLYLKADESKYVMVKVDFTAGITTEIAKIKLSTNAIVAEKGAGDQATLTNDGTAQDVITGDTADAVVGRAVTAVSTGTLTVSVAENNKIDATTTQVQAGTKGLKTLYLNFKAANEDVDLKQLVLVLNDLNAKTAVQSVSLYDGTTKFPESLAVYTQSNGTVTFGNGSTGFATLKKNVSKVLTVVTDLRPIAVGTTGASGANVQWKLANASTSIVATGVASGPNLTYNSSYASSKILFGTATPQADQTGNIFMVRRSLITDITALKVGSNSSTPVDGTSTDLTDGNQEIFRFKITAAANTGNDNSAIDLTALKLTTSANGVTLANVKIFRIDNITSTVNASTTSQDTGSGGYIEFSSVDSSNSLATKIDNITPGNSATFSVTADVSGTATGESVQVSIANLGTQATQGTVDLSAGPIVWSDNDNEVDDILTSWVSWPGVSINNVLGQTRLKKTS